MVNPRGGSYGEYLYYTWDKAIKNQTTGPFNKDFKTFLKILKIKFIVLGQCLTFLS